MFFWRYSNSSLVCHQCGEFLTGEDVEPYRHQVTDIPPVVAEVTEYRLMTDFFQAEVSLGSVPTLEQRTSAALKEPVDETRAYIKKQPVVHLDETGWPPPPW